MLITNVQQLMFQTYGISVCDKTDASEHTIHGWCRRPLKRFTVTSTLHLYAALFAHYLMCLLYSCRNDLFPQTVR